MKIKKYKAAGGIVVNESKILVLHRPSENETRLPKGHIDSGETPQGASLREVQEESGLVGLKIIDDLGAQLVEFDFNDCHIVRTEYYFLMELTNDYQQGESEAQFDPEWVDINIAINLLTYESEKEWVRRAIEILNKKGG